MGTNLSEECVEQNSSFKSEDTDKETDIKSDGVKDEEIIDVLEKIADYLSQKPQDLPSLGHNKRRRHVKGGRVRKHTAQDSLNLNVVTSRGLKDRNWAKVSISPFMNFLRDFRKLVPSDCPVTVMSQKGRLIWKQMSKENKLPYIAQAKRAKERGHTN